MVFNLDQANQRPADNDLDYVGLILIYTVLKSPNPIGVDCRQLYNKGDDVYTIKAMAYLYLFI